MKYLEKYKQYLITESSKNNPIPELDRDKLAIILLGAPGVGKCLEYNTKILLNGKLVKIGEVIENHIDDGVDDNEVLLNVQDFFVNSIASFIVYPYNIDKFNIILIPFIYLYSF